MFTSMVVDPALPLPSVPPGFVYRHTRTLRGITGFEPYPSRDDTPVHSCGRYLDLHLQALGYDLTAKLTIQRALSVNPTMGGFVKTLVSYGVAALEAKYMWYLANENIPAEGEWANTCIS